MEKMCGDANILAAQAAKKAGALPQLRLVQIHVPTLMNVSDW
jgi:hypothetical protein